MLVSARIVAGTGGILLKVMIIKMVGFLLSFEKLTGR